MAMPTSPTTHPVAQQAPPPATTGVQTKDTPGAEPHLLDDILPIYLVKMYPEGIGGSMDALKAEAMKAGAAAHDLGMKLEASQQAEAAPAAPAARREGAMASPAAHTAPAAPHA